MVALVVASCFGLVMFNGNKVVVLLRRACPYLVLDVVCIVCVPGICVTVGVLSGQMSRSV